jgi:hypothetical protein
LVLAANLIVIRREVEATRVAAPKRVLDDEQPAEAVTELVDPLGFSEA